MWLLQHLRFRRLHKLGWMHPMRTSAITVTLSTYSVNPTTATFTYSISSATSAASAASAASARHR